MKAGACFFFFFAKRNEGKYKTPAYFRGYDSLIELERKGRNWESLKERERERRAHGQTAPSEANYISSSKGPCCTGCHARANRGLPRDTLKEGRGFHHPHKNTYIPYDIPSNKISHAPSSSSSQERKEIHILHWLYSLFFFFFFIFIGFHFFFSFFIIFSLSSHFKRKF